MVMETKGKHSSNLYFKQWHWETLNNNLYLVIIIHICLVLLFYFLLLNSILSKEYNTNILCKTKIYAISTFKIL